MKGTSIYDWGFFVYWVDISVILDYISIIIRTMEKINVLVLPSDT